MWDDWSPRAETELKVFSGHKGEVNTCAISPNMDILVTGADDCRLLVWNLSSCKLVTCFKGHSGPVNSCQFSPCGSLLVSGSYDSTARLWDVGNSKCDKVLRAHMKSVEGVCFSGDSNMVCSVSWDKNVIVWNVPTGDVLHLFSGHTDSVRTCSFSLSNTMLATGGWDYRVIVWSLDGDTKNERLSQVNRPNSSLSVLQGHTGNISCVCFARVGILASGSWDRTLKLWNPKRGELIHTFQGHTGWVKSLAFSINSVEMASAADDGSVLVWNIPNLKCIDQLKAKTDLAAMCSFSSLGILFTTGSAKQATQKSQDNSEEKDGEGVPIYV